MNEKQIKIQRYDVKKGKQFWKNQKVKKKRKKKDKDTKEEEKKEESR